MTRRNAFMTIFILYIASLYFALGQRGNDGLGDILPNINCSSCVFSKPKLAVTTRIRQSKEQGAANEHGLSESPANHRDQWVVAGTVFL